MSIHAHESCSPDGTTTVTGIPPRRRLALVPSTTPAAQPQEKRPAGRARRYLRAAAIGQLLCLALLGLVVLLGPGPYPGLLSGDLTEDHGDHLITVEVPDRPAAPAGTVGR